MYKNMSEYNKFSYNTVTKIVNDLGYILISKSYKNSKTKIIIKDKNEYLYYTTLDNLRSNRVPDYVSPYNIFTIRNIKNFIKINDLSCEMLSVKYKGSHDFLIFKCKCGRLYKCNWTKFSSRLKDICNICSGKKKSFEHRIDLNIVYDKFVENNYKPLFDSYLNCYTPLPCEDINGYRGLLSYANATNGCKFGIFSINNPYLLYNIKKYIKINNCTCEILTTDFSTYRRLNDAQLLFKCECGEHYVTTWRSFTWQNVYRCQKCSKKKSKYAIETERYLDECGLKYDKEYSFPDCKDKSILFFDYVIFYKNKIYLIEVDGQFHYQEIYGKEEFQSQIHRDNIKNEYCKINNIPLIRIPYWEYKNNNFKSIILKGVKKIQS